MTHNCKRVLDVNPDIAVYSKKSKFSTVVRLNSAPDLHECIQWLADGIGKTKERAVAMALPMIR